MGSHVPRTFDFIRSYQAFVRLWTARTVSFLGDSVGLVALLLHVADNSGTAPAVALIQRVVPESMLGRVFGNLYGAVGVSAGLSYVVGGLVLDATGPRFVLVAAGTGGLVVTAVVAVLLPRRLARASGAS